MNQTNIPTTYLQNRAVKAKRQQPEKKNLVLLLICSFLFLLFLLSMVHRGLHLDEAILGEHAYWLANKGKVKADMYTGIGMGWEDHLLVYHKLFIWVGAGIISLFGLSLTALRLLSFFFSGLLVFLLYRYCHQLIGFSQSSAKGIFLLCLLLLLSHTLYFFYSFLYRPEIMQACLGFGSFFMLSGYLKRESRFWVAGAAVLAGLAALTHLNGLIFIGAGSLLLLYRKEWGATLGFVALASLVSGFYVIDLLTPEAREQFLWQFRGDPALAKREFSILGRGIKFLTEHKRYFHSLMEASFSIPFLFSLGFGYRFLWKEHRNLLLYTVFAGLGLAALSQGHTSKYTLLILPFMVLLIVLAYEHFRKTNFRKVRALTVLIVLYGITQAWFISDILQKSTDITERNAEIGSYLPDGTKVYATASFFFNQVKNHKLLSTQSIYLQVVRYHNLSWSKKDFFTHVHSLGAEYIVLDLRFQDIGIRKTFSPNDFAVGKTHFGYKVTHAQNDYVIMKKTDIKQEG